MLKKILIVDDSSMIRLALRSALNENGYEVIEAIHGHDGLAKLQSGEKISLVISDVNMPEMDGITFVQTYKAIPELQYIPVLMLTTETGQDKKEVAKAAGVRAWLVKPFNKELLMAAVSKLIA
jgi:two-component system chemotaxis response regulator CheY